MPYEGIDSLKVNAPVWEKVVAAAKVQDANETEAGMMNALQDGPYPNPDKQACEANTQARANDRQGMLLFGSPASLVANVPPRTEADLVRSLAKAPAPKPKPTLTQTEYLACFEAVLAQMLATTRAKNADYAQANDAFGNFRLGSTLRPKFTLEDGVWFRMTDKWARLCSLLDRPPQVKDESLQDTLLDLANYAVILKIWLDFQAEGK